MKKFLAALAVPAVRNTLAAGAFAASALSAHAAVFYDVNVTNAAIFGAGNANGSWTVDSGNGLELGLRAKVRYDVSDDQPKNVYNSNGSGGYNHAAGSPASNPTRARWNFEWSVNTDTSGTSGRTVGDLSYVFGFDFDPSAAKDFQTFNLISGVPVADHSFGNNATASGAGLETNLAATYASYLDTYNLVQNSSNFDFFNEFFGKAFDPAADGVYSFYLAAFDGNTQLGRTDIDIIVGNGVTQVPEPSSIALVGLALLGLGAARRRERSNR